MAEYDDDDDIRAYFSEDDDIPSSHKRYGGHGGVSHGYELPRRSQTYSGNPGNRRSGGARSHRATRYDLDEDDLDEDFDSSRQLSRRGRTDLSKRGHGHFEREAPSGRDIYQPEPDYYNRDYGQAYPPCNERYPPDFGYRPRRHASGDNFPSHSNMNSSSHEIYVHNEYNEYNFFYSPNHGAPAYQTGWSDKNERQGFRDAPPPPVKNSGKKGNRMIKLTSRLGPAIITPVVERLLRRD